MTTPRTSQELTRGRAAAARPLWQGTWDDFIQARLGQILVPAVVVLLIGVWALIVRWTAYPPFILPSPGRVWEKFLTVAASGTLWRHTQVTLTEALLGFGLAFPFATVLGYALARSRLLEEIVSPYIVASQAVPIVALAPLLILWFGAGLLSKVLVCALIVFFPIVMNTMVGIRSVDEQWKELMRSLCGSRWDLFTKIEVPAALPVLLGGVKMGVTLSIIGAVVGEFVAADKGLGFLINLSRGLFDTPLMFVALFTLVTLALILYTTVLVLERAVTPWHQ